MESALKAVIFDMDGLMFDTEHLSTKCWMQTGRDLGVPITEEFLCMARGLTRAEYQRYFECHFQGKLDYRTAMDHKLKLFWETIDRDGVEKKPGLERLLGYLVEHGIDTALATASRQETVEKYMAITGLQHVFSVKVFGDSGVKGKPHPDIFLRAAKELHAAPEECIVLEDSINGVHAGLNGGFHTIMIPDIAQPDKQLRDRVALCGKTLNDVVDFLEEKKDSRGRFLLK
ncbi:HAD family hydrolase [Hominifimenecus sp. rT4P-3]|uniref:HAD family hydrolase n=1 Tax=Hominifimenecus sp. rT4P-3 TaxID=3242979 RepID=UPI003DA6A103